MQRRIRGGVRETAKVSQQKKIKEEKNETSTTFFFFFASTLAPSPLNGTVQNSYPSGHSRVKAFCPGPFPLTGKEQHVILHLIATVSS